MTIKEFQQCVEYNIEHGLRHAILGLGAPGVGKSQVIRQIGEKYGYKVIDIRLAQMSEVEIGGLIYPNETRTKTVWLAPDILPNEERDGKNTILLLDEITSCNKRVQVAAYQLILDRRIGQYHLPEGTFVIALGNREDDDGVYIQLAGPLADRFEIHYIEPDFPGWKNDFAIPHGIHRMVIDYLTFKPTALHSQKAEEGKMVFATPRSWERVSDILKFDDNIYNPVIQHKIIGNVGEIEGPQFIEYCKKHAEAVGPEEFLRGNVMPPSNPEDLSVLIGGLVDLCGFVKAARSEDDLSPEQKNTLSAVNRSFFRLPKAEYTIVGLKGLLECNRPVVKHVFYLLRDENILQFIHNNRYALGMDDSDSAGLMKGDVKNRWMAAWNKQKKENV